MDSNKTIKKLFATLTLSCGLMTSGLMAAELPFISMGEFYSDDGKNYAVVKLLKDGSKQYEHFFNKVPDEVDRAGTTKIRRPFIGSKTKDWGADEEIKAGDFVCSNEILFVLDNLNYYSSGSTMKPEDKETKRAFNKFFRNENDYTLWHESLSRYDFAKGFNLYEKLQIKDELFPSDILSFQYVESNGVIPDKVGLKDIDAFIEIYDGYKDFIPAKAKELVALETDHKQKVLEYACAPVQKVKKGEDEYGDFSYRTTFDETKVIQRIEDLDPTKVLKFIPEQVLQCIK